MSLDVALNTIDEYRGAAASLWSYSASLGELHIRLEKVGKRGNLHIVCNGTQRISASTCWKDAQLEIRSAANKTIEVVDIAAGLKIVCLSARALRDIEPIY